MVMPPDIEAQILRYYHAEKWTVGTIARQWHVHHSVVRRVLAEAGLPKIGAAQRPSPVDAYLPLIRETLERFPTLTASRLFTTAHERGYRGSPDHFRHLVAQHRPRRPAEAQTSRSTCSPSRSVRFRHGVKLHVCPSAKRQRWQMPGLATVALQQLLDLVRRHVECLRRGEVADERPVEAQSQNLLDLRALGEAKLLPGVSLTVEVGLHPATTWLRTQAGICRQVRSNRDTPGLKIGALRLRGEEPTGKGQHGFSVVHLNIARNDEEPVAIDRARPSLVRSRSDRGIHPRLAGHE
jgi:hypothetical protein